MSEVCRIVGRTSACYCWLITFHCARMKQPQKTHMALNNIRLWTVNPSVTRSPD